MAEAHDDVADAHRIVQHRVESDISQVGERRHVGVYARRKGEDEIRVVPHREQILMWVAGEDPLPHRQRDIGARLHDGADHLVGVFDGKGEGSPAGLEAQVGLGRDLTSINLEFRSRTYERCHSAHRELVPARVFDSLALHDGCSLRREPHGTTVHRIPPFDYPQSKRA